MTEFKLFNKWSMDEITVSDTGLERYINLKDIITPHSGGRHSAQRFKKTEVNIVERFINKLMRHGGNAGKKLKVIKSVELSFDLINAKTGENPVQILVNAVINAAPREETTRLSYGGVAQHQAVDTSPLRRVDLALRFLTEGITKASFSNIKSFDEVIADELLAAAANDLASQGVRKKQEIERIAYSAR